MKTCSFGNVQPQQPNKYLFCSIDPQARHEMTACGNCGLCYPKYDVKKRPDGRPPIVFGIESRRHQFVSKYETILNCPCVSHVCRCLILFSFDINIKYLIYHFRHVKHLILFMF